MLRLLPERVKVPSVSALNAAEPPLKQWECSEPLQIYVKAPGNGSHRSPPSPSPTPSSSLPSLKIALQSLSRTSHTRPP